MWARRNEDKLQPSLNNFNAIHNVEDVSGSGTITEPVTLQEAKDYLRIEGFQPDDDSPADQFDFDDQLITYLIKEGRMWCEQYLGGKDLMVGLIPRTLEVWLTNGAGPIRIPGPVTSSLSSITFTDKNGVQLSGQVFWIGTEFPKLESEFGDRFKITYDAGYSSAPVWAKDAIKAYVADHYEFRGDDAPPAANERAAQKCRPYRRVKISG